MPRRLTDVSSDGTLYFTRFNGRTEIWRARVGSSPSLYATLPVHCNQFSVTVSDDGSRAMCNVSSSLPDAWVLDLPRGRDEACMGDGLPRSALTCRHMH